MKGGFHAQDGQHMGRFKAAQPLQGVGHPLPFEEQAVFVVHMQRLASAAGRIQRTLGGAPVGTGAQNRLQFGLHKAGRDARLPHPNPFAGQRALYKHRPPVGGVAHALKLGAAAVNLDFHDLAHGRSLLRAGLLRGVILADIHPPLGVGYLFQGGQIQLNGAVIASAGRKNRLKALQ